MIIENIKYVCLYRRFIEKKINEEEILEMLEGVRFFVLIKNV